MPPTYFTPEWALGKLDVAPQLPVDVKQAINSLANRIEYPRYSMCTILETCPYSLDTNVGKPLIRRVQNGWLQIAASSCEDKNKLCYPGS